MLEKIDLIAIREASRQLGALSTFLYAEKREEIWIDFIGRTQSSRTLQEQGTRVEHTFGTSANTLTLESISTDAILAALKKTPLPGCSAVDPVTLDIQSLKNRLDTLVKRLFPDLDATPSPVLRYHEVKRQFLASAEKGPEQIAHDNFAQIEVEYKIGNRTISLSRNYQNAKQLWDLLEKDPLFLDPKLPQGWENPWPAPEGNLPVLWSKEAVSKLLFPFLRVFDEDRVRRNVSLVNRWNEKWSLRFNLEGSSGSRSENLEKSDHRGHLRAGYSLLTSGTPSGQLAGPHSPGLSRRSRYDEGEAHGFWNVRLDPGLRTEDLLAELPLGLFVQDLKVEHFDPSTGEAIFLLTNAALIHHGAIGEAVLPVKLKGSLLELFSSWELFSNQEAGFGYWNLKNGVRFLTEITAPDAFSRSFFVPGTVSPSHYW